VSFNKTAGSLWGEVLSNLHRHGEIKSPRYRDRLTKISGQKIGRTYLQRGPINIVSVNADHILNAKALPYTEPGTDAATDVAY